MKRLSVCVAILAFAASDYAAAQGFPGGGGRGGFGGRGAPPGGPGARRGPPPNEVGGVVVQVDPTAPRTSIDRRSYSVTTDLQTATGSITDALRNIPSVQVDVEGEVSLRGDSNVTILVDGRPSALFTGEGRGAALQNLPADQIDRVEVITNPSAAFNPEGSAGIINLVTKQSFRPGYSGSVRANVGTEGRLNGGVNAAYQGSKLSASGGLNLRRDTNENTVTDERTRRDATTGAVTNSTRQEGEGKSENTSATARLALNYDIDNDTRIGVDGSYRAIRSESENRDRQEQRDAAGTLTREFERLSEGDQSRDNFQLSGNFRHSFPGDDHEITVDVSREWNNEDRERSVASTNLVPAAPQSFERFDFDGRQVETNVRIDYARPMPKSATLKAGYAFDGDHNTYDNLGRSGTNLAALAVDPNLTYVYDYRQRIHAGYLTYQQPLGKLTVLGGLRLEGTQVDVGLQSPAVSASNSYTYLYPSLHLTYELAQRHTLNASYSMRVQRPRPEDLNPFLIYIDPFNFRQGNPNLRPQETHSYELGYQYRREGSSYQATAYYRQSSGGITDVVRDLGGGVLLNTRENLRESRSGGLELVANGRFSRALTYNVSADVFWNQIDASSLGFNEKRDAFTLSGRANLNWQIDSNDFLQVNAFMRGKRLTAQGYTTGFASVNLGYRHRFSDKLAGIVTAQDVFNSSDVRQVFDTPTLSGVSERSFNRRGIFFGLVWTFGAQQRGRNNNRDPGFEFGEQPEGL